MLPMAGEGVRERLAALLSSFGIETDLNDEAERALELIKYDKKGVGDSTYAVFVDEIGNGRIEKISYSALCERIRSITKGDRLRR